jgi:hypothetical protein
MQLCLKWQLHLQMRPARLACNLRQTSPRIDSVDRSTRSGKPEHENTVGGSCELVFDLLFCWSCPLLAEDCFCGFIVICKVDRFEYESDDGLDVIRLCSLVQVHHYVVNWDSRRQTNPSASVLSGW